MYCTTDDVYGATSLTTDEVTAANVTNFILAAEKDVDDLTYTTYWNVEDSGTATAGGNNILTDDTKTLVADAHIGQYVWIYGGTGSGQMRKVIVNDTDTYTLDRDWDTNPDNTSTYRTIYTATDPYSDHDFDGDGTREYWLQNIPLRILEEVTIKETDVTPANVVQYNELGKLRLGSSAEKGYWVTEESNPQGNTVKYWYGVYELPANVKRLTIVIAAMKTLAAQIGGTFDTPSTYAFPEGSVTIGQAYVNIREAYNSLKEERNELTRRVVKWVSFGEL